MDEMGWIWSIAMDIVASAREQNRWWAAPSTEPRRPFLSAEGGTVAEADCESATGPVLVTQTSPPRPRSDMDARHPKGMENNTTWKKAIRYILGNRKPANDNQACRVAGPHEGPTVTVAAEGDEVIRLCLHHAKAWSDSEPCHDFAATGHTDAARVLADWINLENETHPASPA